MKDEDDVIGFLGNAAELLSMKDPSQYTVVESALHHFLEWYFGGTDV